MTRIRVERKAGKICALTVSGHSGYAEEGSDIVCAAISAITELTANGITEIAGEQITLYSDPSLPEIGISLSEKQAENPLCKAFLEAFLLEATSIAEQYKNYVTINLMEV